MLDFTIRFDSITIAFNFPISSSVNGSALIKEQGRNTRQRCGTPRQLPTVLRLFCRRTVTAAGVGSAGAAVAGGSAVPLPPSAVDGTAVLPCLAGRWAAFRRCILSAVKVETCEETSRWIIFFNRFSPYTVPCAMPPCVFLVAAPVGPPAVVWQITSGHNFIAMCQQRQQRQPVRLCVCVGYCSATPPAPAGRM